MSETIRGGCLCGAVEYAIEPPTQGAAHCHCEYCRLAHGAPVVSWLVVREGKYKAVPGRG